MLWALFFVAILLLALIQALFVLLRRDDAILFEGLGRPDLFTNNNAPQVYRFWRWIYSDALGPSLSAQSRAIAWVIRLLTPIYVLAILVVIWRSLSA